MSSSSEQVSMMQLKKKFAKVVDRVDQENKTSLQSYKSKYYQLIEQLYGLYKHIRKCSSIIVSKSDTDKLGQGQVLQQGQSCPLNQSLNQNELQLDQALNKAINPMAFIDYFREFCQYVVVFCQKCHDKQQKIKQEISKLFSVQNNQNFLQALAKKNLENYDLILKVQQIQSNLQLKKIECRLIQKTAYEYQKKFIQFDRDYVQVVKSISNILKKCQLSQIQLRQENRLQKQLIQTHKIQFERYKSDFKLKPSQDSKIERIKRIIQKKYQDRQAIIIKQSQKIAQKKLKQQKKCSLYHNKQNFKNFV